MNKKRFAMGFLLIAVCAVVAAVYLNAPQYRKAELNIRYGSTLGYNEPEPDSNIHVTVWVKRAGSTVWQFWDHHAGVLTTIGKNFIKGKLGDSAYGANGEFADDISLSTDTGSPAVGWTQIPTEITTGGLDRNTGTYASTGDGTWTITYTFTATAGHTDVQLTGLQWLVTDGSDNNLLAADTFTPVSLVSDDQLTVEWSNIAS